MMAKDPAWKFLMIYFCSTAEKYYNFFTTVHNQIFVRKSTTADFCSKRKVHVSILTVDG